MPDMTEEASGFAFPCEFAIKAMGLAEPGFDTLVLDIVRQHCPSASRDALHVKPSRNGKYVSVTLLIEAHSHDQLNAIYDALTAHEKVLMRL
jgi:putative lipoic acid-binding regulatory protein